VHKAVAVSKKLAAHQPKALVVAKAASKAAKLAALPAVRVHKAVAVSKKLVASKVARAKPSKTLVG
jgi:hypothetical protein